MWQAQGLYSQYKQRTPLILSGKEAIRELYNYPSARIAIIHGASFAEKQLYELTFRKKEIRFISRSWKDEPDLDSLQATLRELESFRPDTIIAVGGGSLIDGAKLCRLFYELPYYDVSLNRLNNELKTGFITVPTLIGSGAEVSSAAVYIQDGSKQMVVSKELLPEVIVYDPRYPAEMSKQEICGSIVDTIAHICEAYVSLIDNRLISYQAEEGLRIIREEITALFNDQDCDPLALQYASYIGGVVQDHCIVGAAHGVAHQLSEYYPHRQAVGLLLGPVIRLNSQNSEVKEKYIRLCKEAGFKDLNDLLLLIEKINECSGISKKRAELREILLKKEDDEAFMDKIRNDRGGKGNPREMNDEYLKELFRSI